MSADIPGPPARPTVNYLRLSVTDRCNLRCRYCMREEGVHWIPHTEVLRYEELLRVVELTVRRGIRKVRITGGEPLIRNGLCAFVRELSRIRGLEEIVLSTNGVLLGPMARDLKKSGVQRVNVSMDTLDPRRFERLTGRDQFHAVWEGIDRAERAGLLPIKLNTVVIRGLNDDEVADIARLTISRPFHVRFIEFMPLGGPIRWKPELVVPAEEVKRKIQALGPLTARPRGVTDGPADRYNLEGAQGEIGFISAVTHGFCDSCNRLRLTADGRLRTCLFSDDETDLKAPMRNGATDADLLDILDDALARKPVKHRFSETETYPAMARRMWGIGG